MYVYMNCIPLFIRVYLLHVDEFSYLYIIHVCVCMSVFLISLLAQIASYLALHSSLFGPVAQLIMIIIIVTNSINFLLIGLRCIPNDAHTNHC